MLCIIPFFAGDKPQAIRLAEWIAELGGVKGHDCLLAVHKDTDSAGVIEPLTEAFGRVAEFTISDDMIVEREQHAWAANVMWKRTLNHVSAMNEPQPWLWLEPDAVPLVKTWLDQIDAAYQAGGRPFMHCLVETTRGKSNSGCGVYPVNVCHFTDRLWELSNVSWDIHLFEEFSKHTYYTPLIQDVGFMLDGKTLPTFEDHESLTLLRPAAVLFHRCKDGTLMDRLREEKDGITRKKAFPVLVDYDPSTGRSDPPTSNGREKELEARIAQLEALVRAAIPAAPPTQKLPVKAKAKAQPKRTAAQIAADKARMAKARAARKPKLTGVV